MILNEYEEYTIDNEDLPENWRSQNALDELEDFVQHNWEQRSVFYDDNKIESRQQFLKFLAHGSIKTQNYIGTIVFKGEQLNIFPKVFRKHGSYRHTEKLSLDHLMKNLIRWLEYCSRMSYPFINISSELKDAQDLRELFMTLYVGYVRNAIERGLFYQYIDETEDISCIKGKFDIRDYYTNKIPNGQADKFRCTYSKFEFDNIINRIIKHTCKIILSSTKSRKNQSVIRRILIRMNEVADVQCNPSDCDRIRLSRLNSQYRIILNMSKMFLLNKTSTYTMDTTESFCFLFPTELLFEGFIGGYIQELVEGQGGKVYLQKSELHLIDDVRMGKKSYGAAFTLRHDILVEYKDKLFILDTKYKQIDRFADNPDDVLNIVNKEVKQHDVYQVCEYARKRGVPDVYLLYPLYRYEENEPENPWGPSEGEGFTINVHFVRLPFIFEEDDSNTKQRLSAVIHKLFDCL